MRNQRSSPLLAAALVTLSITGCGGASNAALSPYAMMRSVDDTGTFTPGHLYVADSGFFKASKVYRYPLDADGLPSKTPDGELTVSAENPGSIAIGAGGDLYITSASTIDCAHKCYVDVFAPRASGAAKPTRVLFVPQNPLYVAVDQLGYLDVSVLDPGNATNVYAPNAQGHAKPINTITTTTVNALAASHGIVYVQNIKPGVGVEGIPEHASHPPPVYYTYGFNFSADGVALDAGNLYAQFFWQTPYGGYLLATAVYPVDMPGSPVRTIIGTGCRVSRNGGALGYGLAAYKKYIYEGCIDIGGANGSVFVYNSLTNGKEAPILTLPGGNAGIAIGP